MVVWIALWVDYDDASIEGVLDSEEKAKVFAQYLYDRKSEEYEEKWGQPLSRHQYAYVTSQKVL